MNDANRGAGALAPNSSNFVPAAPGWTLHGARLTDECAAELHAAPIVAWRIEDDVAHPVTIIEITGRSTLIETPAPARFFSGPREISGIAAWADSLIEGRRRELAAEAEDVLA